MQNPPGSPVREVATLCRSGSNVGVDRIIRYISGDITDNDVAYKVVANSAYSPHTFAAI